MARKRIISGLCLLMVTALLALPAFAAPLEIEVFKGTPVVDGVKDELYNYTTTYPIANKTSGSTGTTTGAMNALWDGNKLYIYIESYDTTPYTGALEQAYLADCIEYFFDLNNKRGDTFAYDDYTFIQLRIDNMGNVTGNNTGDSWILQPEVTDNVKFVIGYLNGKDLSGGYALEMSFDTSAFVTLSEGKTIGFDIQLADVEDGSVRVVQAFIGNTETALLDTQYNTPTNLGANIVLKGALPVLAAAPEIVAPDAGGDSGSAVVTSAQTSDFLAVMTILPAVSSLLFLALKKKKV